MGIEFTISVEDLICFLNVHQASSATYRRLVLAARFGGALLIFGVPFLLPVPLLVQGLVGGVMFLLWVLFLPKVLARSTERMVRQNYGDGRNPGLIGWHRLTLENEGLREASEAGERLMPFAGIDRIAETPSHVFVYLGAAQGYVIPRASVKGELEAFLLALAARLKPPAAA